MCNGCLWMNNDASTGVHTDLSRKWGSVPVAIGGDVKVNVLDIHGRPVVQLTLDADGIAIRESKDAVEGVHRHDKSK